MSKDYGSGAAMSRTQQGRLDIKPFNFYILCGMFLNVCFLCLKATASVTPQHWQPNSGLLMANDVPENPETAVPCIALSKNDSYVKSACGGKVSLFNMMTFKVSSSNPTYFKGSCMYLCMWGKYHFQFC